MPRATPQYERIQRLLPLKPHDCHVLLGLSGGERHGYGLVKDIQRRSGGRIRLEPANLYRLLPTNTLLPSEQLLAASVAEPRFALLLLTVLAAIAVTLAALGLYGVISYAVSERTREIGIRVALGARHNAVVGLVMLRGIFIAGAGVLLGLFLAFNGAYLVEGLLFGVRARDPLTFFLANVLLVGVALLACWRPARRAARIDPASRSGPNSRRTKHAPESFSGRLPSGRPSRRGSARPAASHRDEQHRHCLCADSPGRVDGRRREFPRADGCRHHRRCAAFRGLHAVPDPDHLREAGPVSFGTGDPVARP